MADGQDIFCFERCGEAVYADPMAIERRLRRALGIDPAEVIGQCHSEEDGLAELAYAKLARAACTAFDLGEPFDPKTGRGVREADWIPILNAYVEWVEKKNPSAGSPPTSPPPTGPASSASPTPSGSDSGTSSPGRPPGSPTPSASASGR